MKIVIAGPAYPYRGGLAAYNERLARQFISEGNDVEIFTFKLQYPNFLFPGKTQFSEGDAPKGLKITRAINSINPVSWVTSGLRLRKLAPDILIIRYWLPFMAPCLATIARIVRGNKYTVVICLFDNVIPHEKRPGDKILTRFFTKSIHSGVTMSQSVRDDLESFNPSIPIALSPHPLFDNFGDDPGREISLEMLGLESKNKYLLFFGFIRAYKGLDLLLEGFADSLVRGRGKVKLIVAGEFYENSEKYMRIISERGIENDVILFDRFIKDDEVKYFFGAADIIVQPYKSATQSGVTQIAYHFNKPMIVTDVGGLKEMVPDGECGFVVEPESTSVRDAIDKYFANDYTAAFAKGIALQKSKFAWDRLTMKIIELYHKLRDQKT